MKTYHIVMLSVPALSHVRPMLALATRIVLQREDIIMTIFLSPDTLDKGLADLQYLSDDPILAAAAKRMRILATFTVDPTDNLLTAMAKSGDTYTAYYKALVAGSAPITCAAKGTVFPAVAAPVAAIIDFIAVRELQATRAVTGRDVPIIAMNFTPAAPFVRLFGPESMGGMGDLGARVDAEVERTGRDAATVGAELYFRAVGEVINIPGLPAMYDYEAFPQEGPKGPMATFLRAGYASMMDADGLILTACKAYDNSGSLDALKAHRMEAYRKPTFALGPSVPVRYTAGTVGSRGDAALEAFLQEKHEKYGENSVIFMSFGTMNWPTTTDNVEEVIECLIEKEMPFIFCYAAPVAQLPEALVAKVHASGLGYLTKWVPQHYVLTHPATGWFLTHAGWGGVVESLAAGVPMICWPFSADQPFNSLHLSANLNVAIELLEVRTGDCGVGKPLYRNGRAARGTREAVREEFVGVIDAVRGEKGRELRANAARLREEFEEAWKEGAESWEELTQEAWEGAGKSWRELQEFLYQFVDVDQHRCEMI